MPTHTIPSLHSPLGKTFQRHAHSTPRRRALAVLRHAESPEVAREFWLAHEPAEQIAETEKHSPWAELVLLSAAHRASSVSGAARLQFARRGIAHVVRPLDAPPAEVVKTKVATASVAALSLAPGRDFETIPLNVQDLKVIWNKRDAACSSWLKLGAKHARIQVRTAPSKAHPGYYKLRRVPSSFEWDEMLRETVDALVAGQPSELGDWLLSVTHPAWHYSTDLTPADWLAVVEVAAGLRAPRTSRHKQLVYGGPAELDLQLDAVAARDDAATARALAYEKRAAETRVAQERKAHAAAFIKERGGFPASWQPLEHWSIAWAELLPTLDQDLRPFVERQIISGVTRRHKHKPGALSQALAILRNETHHEENLDAERPRCSGACRYDHPGCAMARAGERPTLWCAVHESGQPLPNER